MIVCYAQQLLEMLNLISKWLAKCFKMCYSVKMYRKKRSFHISIRFSNAFVKEEKNKSVAAASQVFQIVVLCVCVRFHVAFGLLSLDRLYANLKKIMISIKLVFCFKEKKAKLRLPAVNHF